MPAATVTLSGPSGRSLVYILQANKGSIENSLRGAKAIRMKHPYGGRQWFIWNNVAIALEVLQSGVPASPEAWHRRYVAIKLA